MSAMLITKAQMVALIENGKRSKEAQRHDQFFDPKPVVKLFTPNTQNQGGLCFYAAVDTAISLA